MKKILYITGCLGFMGSYFTRMCLKKGWFVKGIDKVTYAANLNFLSEFETYPNFNFEKVDINHLNRLIDCDYFVNFCAESHVDNSIVNSEDFIDTNVKGVYHILQLLRNYKTNGYKIPTLYHLSTDETYGDIEQGSHVETDLLRPSNPYSATKACSDMLITAWSRTFGIPYVLIRPTNNYGVGQYVEKLIPKTCKYLSIEKRVDLHNKGEPKRVWLHAEDTANAILTVIDSSVKNEIFNISGNYEDKNINVVKKIINTYYGNPIDFEVKNIEFYVDFNCNRNGQDVRYSLDDSKIKKLGWKPKKYFDEELPKIVKYYKDNFIW